MPEFRLSVDRFALQALDPQYLPFKKEPLQSLSLSAFLFNPFAHPELASSFLLCLSKPPQLIYSAKPKYTKIQQTLTNRYINMIRNGIKSISDLSSQDIANLTRAANKIGSFCEDYGKEIEGNAGHIVDAFLEASRSFVKYDLTKFDTGLLTRKWVWEKFPNYLQQKGYLVSKQPFSIYNYN